MKNLENILNDYSDGLHQGQAVDLEKELKKFSSDLRFGYAIQLVVISVIFLIALGAVLLMWQDSKAIASFFGALGIGGFGWFLKEIRVAMREYNAAQILLFSSSSMSEDQLNRLIEIVRGING